MDTIINTVIFRDILFFIKGVIAGIIVSIPVGPGSIISMRQTLTRGWRMGMAAGMGVAVADTFYGALAGLGLTSLVAYILSYFEKIQKLAAIVLIALGILMLFRNSKPDNKTGQDGGYIRAFLSTLSVTLTNPLLIFMFTAVFANIDIREVVKDYDLIFFLVSGIFVGAAAWWVMLCSGILILKERFKITSINWMNRLSGGLILVLGALALYHAF